jgi:PAS domain S-box-containing protein
MLLVNKTAYRLFGYERGELEGKNISLMMPSPFSERHNGYLKNYLMTGVAKILNQDRQVVCLRKVGMWQGQLLQRCCSTACIRQLQVFEFAAQTTGR